MHPSGALGTKFEVGLGSAQFKLRAPVTCLHIRNGGLWIEVDCSTDRPLSLIHISEPTRLALI
eukprot:7378964-Alexandrium_andersonii.AAC.1